MILADRVRHKLAAEPQGDFPQLYEGPFLFARQSSRAPTNERT